MRAKKLKGRAEARKPTFTRSPGKPASSPGVTARTRGAAGAGGGVGGARVVGGGGAGGGGGKCVVYSAEENILVVGDGDFSFSQGLVKHRKGRGVGLTLTSFDSAQEVLKKYKTAKGNIEKCQAAGAKVVHGMYVAHTRTHTHIHTHTHKYTHTYTHTQVLHGMYVATTNSFKGLDQVYNSFKGLFKGLDQVYKACLDAYIVLKILEHINSK